VVLVTPQPPDPREIDPLLEQIRMSAGGTAGRDAARAEIDFRIAGHVVVALQQLSGDIDVATREFSRRTTALIAEMGELRRTLDSASAASSRQADALVRWTKAYVIATVVLVLLTLFSVVYPILWPPAR
jgi:hypothetical protein